MLPQKFGCNGTFEKYEDLEKAYGEGKVHPQDLKESVAVELSKIIDPIRKHFEKPENKKLLDIFKEAEITR